MKGFILPRSAGDERNTEYGDRPAPAVRRAGDSGKEGESPIVNKKETKKTVESEAPVVKERPGVGFEFLHELDQYLFGKGVHYDIFRKLGAHPSTMDGKKGIHFAVWAPHAAGVNLIGEFNGWDEESIPMERLDPVGFWEAFLPEAKEGQMYKYLIHAADGRKLYKADPYANQAEKRPGTASVIADISKIRWTDSAWMKKQETFVQDSAPISIYECHIGSWMRHPHGNNEDGFYNYRYFAHSVTDYLKKMGYTHIELMGIAEHPFDGSWGYQVTGYFAPTSRYGTPEDFAYMVNYLHRHNIGVILDWVPAHFPRDAHGLAEFDGTPCYEYADPRKGEHPDWGTKVFDFGKSEVKNFLIGNALFWIEQFHVDGLRVDAVASILYLDYGRRDGEWVANEYGGNKNLEAIEFFKHLNSVVRGKHPGIMMIAEESTAYPGITAPTDAGGVGFGLKWNMGWMHDTLQYLHETPINRKWHHDEITFSMVYAYSERYVLPISHDEVVYGKGSLFGKMPGDNWQKYAGVRALFAYQWAHPGKKLTFMGNELAQWGEWDHDNSIDWDCLNWQEHMGVQRLVADLNKLYKETPAIWSQDFTPDGFQWLTSDDADHNTLSFVRIGTKGEECVVVVNFSGEAWSDYQVALPHGGRWKEVLTTDSTVYGGSGISNGTFEADAGEYHSRPASARITVPALAAVFLKPEN